MWIRRWILRCFHYRLLIRACDHSSDTVIQARHACLGLSEFETGVRVLDVSYGRPARTPRTTTSFWVLTGYNGLRSHERCTKQQYCCPSVLSRRVHVVGIALLGADNVPNGSLNFEDCLWSGTYACRSGRFSCPWFSRLCSGSQLP